MVGALATRKRRSKPRTLKRWKQTEFLNEYKKNIVFLYIILLVAIETTLAMNQIQYPTLPNTLLILKKNLIIQEPSVPRKQFESYVRIENSVSQNAYVMALNGLIKHEKQLLCM